MIAVDRKPRTVCFYTKGIVLNRGPLFKRWTLLILRPVLFQSLINGLSILLLLLAAPPGLEPRNPESESGVLPIRLKGNILDTISIPNMVEISFHLLIVSIGWG